MDYEGVERVLQGPNRQMGRALVMPSDSLVEDERLKAPDQPIGICNVLIGQLQVIDLCTSIKHGRPFKPTFWAQEIADESEPA